MSNNLDETDRASAAVAIGPRVSLTDIQMAIAAEWYTTAWDALGDQIPKMESLKLLTICIVSMKNGFVIIGKSAPAYPQNFNADLGRKFAYEDAIRQIWPLMGFALKERLHGEPT